MKYNLKEQRELNKAMDRFEALAEKGAKIELKEIRPTRSLPQNAYLHVCLSLYGIHFGYTLNEAKTDLKRNYGLVYEKNGKKYLKSTSTMDSKELTEFIEYIRDVAGQNGCWIPTAEEYLQNKFSIDKEIENNKIYLKQ
mgnify:CR=1 FL=1